MIEIALLAKASVLFGLFLVSFSEAGHFFLSENRKQGYVFIVLLEYATNISFRICLQYLYFCTLFLEKGLLSFKSF